MLDTFITYLKTHWKSIAVFTLVFGLLLIPFIYRLGSFALFSYDEAWYAAIARNSIRNADFFDLSFNQERFNDHPPLGFALMSLSIFLFGENEFAIRLVSAVSGVLCLFLMYLAGKLIANKWVGVTAAAMLFSSLWFMFRARSGNLDILLLLFITLALFSLLKALKHKQFLYLATVGLAFALLTKTMVGLGLLPAFAVTYFYVRKQLTIRYIWRNFLLLFAIVFPWYAYQIYLNPPGDGHMGYIGHFFTIGLKPQGNTISFENVLASLRFLSIASGKWFKVSLLGGLAALILLWKKPAKRQMLRILLVTLVGFGVPMMITKRIEIWHLLPLLPPLYLLTAYAAYDIWSVIAPKYSVLPKLTMIFFMAIAVFQFWQFSSLLYPVEAFSGQKDIGIASRKYNRVYLFETFYPSLVYYADVRVEYANVVFNKELLLDQLLANPTDENYAILINKATFKQLQEAQKRVTILYENPDYYLVK